MSHTHRHATGPAPFSPLLAGTLALLALAGVVGEAAAQAGAAIDHWRRRPPLDPLALALELADGRTRWPPAATPILIAAARGVRAEPSAWSWSLAPAGRSTGADRAARLLGTGRSAHSVSLAERASDRCSDSASSSRDCRSRRAIAGGQPLYATWEDMQCDIWGPRKGKSTSRAIPTVLAAPGAAFATSNKPDLYAATRGLRERQGRVWNFDPEQLAAGRARLVVEPAHLRHLRPPRARADRRVRRRLPRPGRAP